MAVTTVLLLSSNEAFQERVRRAVAAIEGCRLQTVPDVEGVRAPVQRGALSVLLIHLPDSSGEELVAGALREVAAGPSRVAPIVLCDSDDVPLKSRLLRRGVVDCLLPPLDMSRLSFLVDILTVRSRQAGPQPAYAGGAEGKDVPAASAGFLVATPAMRELMERVRAVAPLEMTVLLTGETGTGKTHLARTIHQMSFRRSKPLVEIECGSLAPTLFESELFGHVRGAFTGADRDRPGKLAHAQDGTILLDDVDCVPLDVQAKLLRVVEDRVFEPVGSERSRPLAARLIVASNQRLEKLVAEGRFRKDLYYRLNAVHFHLPAIQEQRELIPLLANEFLARFRSAGPRASQGFSPAALSALKAYDWPGNARELRHVTEGAVAFCSGDTIELGDLPERIREAYIISPGEPEPRPSFGRYPAGKNGLALARETAECGRLREALRLNGNNRTRTALELGISRTALYKKMRHFGLI